MKVRSDDNGNVSIGAVIVVVAILAMAGFVASGCISAPEKKDIIKEKERLPIILQPQIINHWNNQTIYVPTDGISEASYIIFKDDSGMTCAKNGTSGRIDFRSSDSSSIIEQTVRNLPNYGGLVFMKAGIYQITSTIDLTNCRYFVLEGEGYGSYMPQTQGRTVLLKEFAGGPVIDIDYTVGYANSSFQLSKFAIYTEDHNYSGDGINVAGSANFWSIENVAIQGLNGTGIDVDHCKANRMTNVNVWELTNGDGIHYNDTYDWQWYYVEVDTNWQTSGYSALKITNCAGQIIGGHFEGWRGLYMESSNIIADCIYIPWARERAIYVNASCVFQMSNSKVNGSNATGEYTGIYATDVFLNSTRCQLSNNKIGNYASYGVYARYSLINLQVGLMLSNNQFIKDVNSTGWSQSIDNNFFYGYLAVIGNKNTITSNQIVGKIISIGNDNRLISNTISGDHTIGGLRTQYDSNVGLISRAYGGIVFAANQTELTFNHTLFAKPTIILFSNGHPDAGTYIVSHNDATTITIQLTNATASQTGKMWYAEV